MNIFLKNKEKKQHFYLRGFTLLELMVSVAIIAVLTGIVLINYPEGSMKITLSNINNKAALLIREAQVRGSAIDSNNTTLAAESPVGGYGVHVTLANPDRFILFADSVDALQPKPYGLLVGDGLYQTTPINELYSTTMLPSGYSVKKICVGSSFPYTCNSYGSPAVSALTISFTRPSPQPAIYINNSRTTSYSSACIELNSPRAPGVGHIRSISVYTSGMIRTALTKCDTN